MSIDAIKAAGFKSMSQLQQIQQKAAEYQGAGSGQPLPTHVGVGNPFGGNIPQVQAFKGVDSFASVVTSPDPMGFVPKGDFAAQFVGPNGSVGKPSYSQLAQQAIFAKPESEAIFGDKTDNAIASAMLGMKESPQLSGFNIQQTSGFKAPSSESSGMQKPPATQAFLLNAYALQAAAMA